MIWLLAVLTFLSRAAAVKGSGTPWGLRLYPPIYLLVLNALTIQLSKVVCYSFRLRRATRDRGRAPAAQWLRMSRLGRPARPPDGTTIGFLRDREDKLDVYLM